MCRPQCRKHTEVNRLKREIEGIHDRLKKLQGDKVAHDYLNQFAVQAGGAVPAAGARSLNGLGQASQVNLAFFFFRWLRFA